MTTKPKEGARLLDEKSVLNITSLPRSTMYELLKAGSFPAQVDIMDPATGQRKRIARWRQSDVERWINGLPTKQPTENDTQAA
tara:strand:- start:488 stop:736 length:249 start_codon:yes stop_codon:yes gene_type:complete